MKDRIKVLPEIAKLLVLSTGHLKLETREWLNEIDFDKLGPSGGRINFGYFFYAHDEQASLGRPGDPCGDIPDDIWACMVKANELGCRYLKFDCDAEDVGGLPYYGDTNEVQ